VLAVLVEGGEFYGGEVRVCAEEFGAVEGLGLVG
jgi:hypothetical protein